MKILKILIVLGFFLGASTINAQQELSNDDIKFAARYILYLEKKTDLQAKMIFKLEQLNETYELQSRQKSRINDTQQLQIEMLSDIVDKLKDVNPYREKKFYEEPVFYLGLGYLAGSRTK